MLFRDIGKSPGRPTGRAKASFRKGTCLAAGLRDLNVRGLPPDFRRFLRGAGRIPGVFAAGRVWSNVPTHASCLAACRGRDFPGSRAAGRAKEEKTLVQPISVPAFVNPLYQGRNEGRGVDHGFCFFAAVQRQRFSGMPFRICRVGRGACPARGPEGKSTVSVSFCSALDGEG